MGEPLVRTDRLEFDTTSIEGVYLCRRNIISDSRGSFSRIFCDETFTLVGWATPAVQINISTNTTAGTLRGLHYQVPPSCDAKVVTALTGRVWDVAVDLRAGSPTFLNWVGCELDASRGEALLIPPGCAHGFQTLTSDASLLYLHDKRFDGEKQAFLNPLCPSISVKWPIPITTISDRDQNAPSLAKSFTGIVL